MGESKYADVCESKFGDGGESKSEPVRAKNVESKSEDVSLMLRATNFCFSSEFIGVFEKFIEENAYVFFDTVDSGEEEHKLEYHDLFKEYLVVYEDTMENWLKDEGVTLAEFNEQIKEAHDAGTISEKYFVKLLVASGEYDCFYDVMIKEARKQRLGDPRNSYDCELD